MRWLAGAVAAVIVMLIAYLAWPLFGLKRMADAIDRRDGAEFAELLDVPRLKRALAAQLVRTHLKVTGRDQRLSPMAQNLAVQAGMALADAYVVELVRAEALIDLLRRHRIETSAGPTSAGPSAGAPVRSFPSLRVAGSILASEYRGTNFYVSVPLGVPEQDSYRLRLRLQQWKWKLAGVDLPEHVRVRLVQEYQRHRGGR